MSRFSRCWRLLFPWAAAQRQSPGLLMVHVALWAAIFAAAWRLNGVAPLDGLLVLPWPFLQTAWLPLMALLAYGAGSAFAGMLAQAEAGSVRHAFADIDEAWQDALVALRQAQLDPTYLPIFLVLGKPAHGVRSLWEASSLHTAVAAGPETPFGVTASRGAIFIWCGGLTRLGQSASSASMLSPLQLGRRFESLLLHLAAMRRPYCPINGILALMSSADAETDAAAETAREQCQQDVQQVRAVLGIDCPTTLLIGGLDQDQGFRDLLDRLPEAERWQALGQRFPLMPDIDPHEVAPMHAGGVAWFCRLRLAALVYEHLAGEDAAMASNARMVSWLAEMQTRADRFGRWTAALACGDFEAAPLITGCFFAATGATAASQGCVGGVFKTLVEHQDHVAWAAGPLRHEAVYRRWTRWALASAGVTAAVAAVGGWLG